MPQPTATSSPRSRIEPISKAPTLSVVVTLPGMDRAEVKPDLVYRTGDSARLALDVYYPPHRPVGGRLPAVLFAHGGPVPPNVDTKRQAPFVSWAQLAAASSLVGVPFNWRLSSPDDIDAAVQYIHDHADTLGIDQDRLCLFAFSGGVSAATTRVLRGAPGRLKCLVAYYGDFSAPLNDLRQGAAQPLIPMLIAKAAQDEYIRGESADAFVSQASANGAHIEFLVHPDGVHAFDIRQADDHSRTIIKQTLAFLRAVLGQP